MFSSLYIRRCGKRKSKSTAATPEASVAFPAPVLYPLKSKQKPPSSWRPRKAPATEGQLELVLTHKLSEGRIGVTYAADVVNAPSSSSDSLSMPTSVCVKFAKKYHCRSLAREAWYYEQLSDCQGIAVPRSYGFFASKVSQQRTLRSSDSLESGAFAPWSNLEFDPDEDENDDLNDDAKRKRSGARDIRGLRDASAWNTWELDEEDPTIAVLVLELLGGPWHEQWENKNEERIDVDAQKIDLIELLEDVADRGVLHGDVAPRNILSFAGPSTPDRYCERHGRHHQWRIIDFDGSARVDVLNVGESARNLLYGAKHGLDLWDFRGYIWNAMQSKLVVPCPAWRGR